MKRINCLYIILIVFLVFQSCRKDVDEIEIISPSIPPISKVISSVHGIVVNDNGDVVSGAIVTYENESVETDKNGVFQFLDKKLNKNGTFISVKKEGYFNGSRRFYPSVGTKSIVNIELISLEVIGTFSSAAGSNIEHDGVELEFPKGAISTEDGTSYTGVVNVAVAYIDPSDVNNLDQMPGDLTGSSTDGDLVALQSLGMIAVELMDDNGNKLQVKEGELVDVKIPIPSGLLDAAPASIPMWHFNEEVGIWQEEGFADLVGNNYETSLAYFSFWNCDIPRDYALVKGSIINRGIPIQGITVVITDLNDNTSGYAITDENGMFCGFVPGGTQLVLSVYNQCGEVIYTTIIEPLVEDIFLEPISLNIFVDFTFVTGTATYCEGDLSEYAYVILRTGTKIYSFPILDDGTFSGNIFYCGQLQEVTVTAFDPLNGYISGEYNFSIEGDIEVGNIELCDSGFVEHIIIEHGNEKWNLLFDDLLFNIFSFTTDVVNGGDEGFILKSLYESEPDSIDLFKFYISYVEGVPIQPCVVEHCDPSNLCVGASGLCSSQLVMKDGVEYFLASGSISGNNILPSLTNEPIYFDILIKNK